MANFNIPIDTGIEGGTVNISGSVSLGGYGDSSSIDAFARLRVSNPVTLFENKQVYDNQPLIWSESTASGGGITYNSGDASTTLSTNGSNGSTAIRQSKQRINYQPGKSLLIFATFVMGSAGSNLRKRIGYFDANNGIYFEQTESTITETGLRLCIRNGSSTAETAEQLDWNIDPLDGTGPSGITLDITKSQILAIDIEWLGVGRVRVGFVINGLPIYVHQFNHANLTTGVYMGSPNLPVRYEIANTAAGDAGSLEEICATAISEGGYSQLGILRSANRGSTSIGFKNTDGKVPVMSIRLKSAYVGATITPTDISIACASATTYLWELILNPTIAPSGGPPATDPASWTDVSNSAIQYDITRGRLNTVSGGTVIKSGYVIGQGNTVTTNTAGDLTSLLVMSADINNTPDQLVLAVTRLDAGAGNVDFYSSVSWREML